MLYYKYLFKFIIVGETGVGKTCLLFQYTTARFNPVHEVTVGSGYGSRMIAIDDKPIKLQLWDTAGTEQFRAITRSYYRGAVGALLVYDVTQRDTFKKLTSWLDDIRKEGGESLTVTVVANKCDVEGDIRVVSEEEGKEFARVNGCSFKEVSARTGVQVEEVFDMTANEIYKKIGKGVFGEVEESSVIRIGNWREKKIEVAVTKRFSSCCG